MGKEGIWGRDGGDMGKGYGDVGVMGKGWGGMGKGWGGYGGCGEGMGGHGGHGGHGGLWGLWGRGGGTWRTWRTWRTWGSWGVVGGCGEGTCGCGWRRGRDVGHTGAVAAAPRCPRRVAVAVGAPRANTSQPHLTEPGAVFLCSWPPGPSACQPVPIDSAGGWGQPHISPPCQPTTPHRCVPLCPSVSLCPHRVGVGPPPPHPHQHRLWVGVDPCVTPSH